MNLVKKIKERSFLAQNLVIKRDARGWTQEKLAEIAGVGLNTIREIETDRSGGRPTTKEKLAKALGCSIAELTLNPPPATTPFNPEQAAKGITPEIVAKALRHLESRVRPENSLRSAIARLATEIDDDDVISELHAHIGKFLRSKKIKVMGF